MANRTSIDRSSSEIGAAGAPASGDIEFSRPLPTSTLEKYENSQATHSLEDFPDVINDILQSDVSALPFFPALGTDTPCRMELICYYLA